jgi:hypothetical protein
MTLTQQILQLLFEHSEKPMDFVAVFMFLNTGPVGQFEDHFSDDEIRDALTDLLQRRLIRAWDAESEAEFESVAWGAVPARIALTPEGQSALFSS